MKIVTSALQLRLGSEIGLDRLQKPDKLITYIHLLQHTGAFFMPLVPESVIQLLCCMPDFWQQFSYSVITLQARIFIFIIFLWKSYDTSLTLSV
jgi:hypothetical protein